MHILVFVDDLLICGNDRNKIETVNVELSKRFSMKDLGEIRNYIGIDIDYKEDNNILTLS